MSLTAKSEEYSELFGLTEVPIDDFSCAIEGKAAVLLHGFLWITFKHICFYSDILGIKTVLVMPLEKVISIEKTTVHVINPGIAIRVEGEGEEPEEHIFASFLYRDGTFNIVHAIWWKNANAPAVTQKAHELHELFGPHGLTHREVPVEDFSCAIGKEILLHGRMWVTFQHICFISDLIVRKTVLVVPLANVTRIKRTIIHLINPAIIIRVEEEGKEPEEHIFASFMSRDRAASMLKAIHGNLNPDRTLHDSPNVSPRPGEKSPGGTEGLTPGSLARQRSKVLKTSLKHELLKTHVGHAVSAATSALFDDESPFFSECRAAYGGWNFSAEPWKPSGVQGRIRQLSWEQPVKNPMSPVNKTRIIETQRMEHDDVSLEESTVVVVHSKQTFTTVPYCESFSVATKWIITASGGGGGDGAEDAGCWIRVSTEVVFSKGLWVQGLIEKTTLRQSHEAFTACRPLIARLLPSQPSATTPMTTPRPSREGVDVTSTTGISLEGASPSRGGEVLDGIQEENSSVVERCTGCFKKGGSSAVERFTGCFKNCISRCVDMQVACLPRPKPPQMVAVS